MIPISESPPLDIAISVERGHARLTLTGEIDINNADTVEAATHQQLDDPDITRVSADLGAISFIDSSGLRALIHSRRHADELGKTFLIEGQHGSIAQAIEITGLTGYLTDPHHQPD